MTALRSGDLAAAAGVNPQTLRYYERRGLLAEPRRSPGGHRLYPAEAVTLLRAIKAAQRLGFTLDEIGELLDAGHRRRDAGLRTRAEGKLADVTARIADLRLVADALRAALSAGCDDLVACAAEPACPLPFPPPPTGTRADRPTASPPRAQAHSHGMSLRPATAHGKPAQTLWT